MLGDEKNLKDPERKPSASYGASSQLMSNMLSYTKTNKLITALYMVTDIVDTAEPLRNKLRTLGTEIISDIYSISLFPDAGRSIKATNRIAETISFLEIASTINIISEMNCSILKKEFFELKRSLEESIIKTPSLSLGANLSEFFKEELPQPQVKTINVFKKSIGHHQPTRIGVQKGSTLMKALSDKASSMSDTVLHATTGNSFDDLKKERRDEIINIIKNISKGMAEDIGATITDIKSMSQGPVATCSEKTLQRELVSMVKDNVLYKTGSKRWSRYFLPK